MNCLIRQMVGTPTWRLIPKMKINLKRTYKTDTIDWVPIKTKNKDPKYEKDNKFGRGVFLTLLIAMPVISFGLGTWQIKRLREKVALISACEDRLTYFPLTLPKNVDPTVIGDFEYRRVLVTGKFDYEQEMFVGPRMQHGQVGYLVVCPIIRSDGGKPILIERGWIAKDKVEPSKRQLRHLSMPETEVTVECLLRTVPGRGMFHFDHEKGSRLFHNVFLDEMADQAGTLPIYAQATYDMSNHPDYHNYDGSNIPKSNWNFLKFWQSSSNDNTTSNKKYDPVAISQKFEHDMINHDYSTDFSPLQFIKAGVPIGKEPKLAFTNNHVQYICTWYGLCIASSICLYVLTRGRAVNPTKDKLKHAQKWM